MTEAARALRAIFLNIVGDTKTEIEEGVTWTTGEIAGLRDVIKLYAKDAWDAAQASEGIIDPMEAIAGLAKSVKDGVLSEAKLMEMVSDIGGKLRTSQLLAIVNNWDMYESTLDTYRNAYGSAEKEIDNAMDSWSRKTNVLKNTWTEFVKTGLNSDAFKSALDALTWFVERLGTLPGLLTRLIPLFAALKLRDMAKNMKEAGSAANTMAEGMKAVGSTAKTLNWISLILTAISIAWNTISMAQEDAKIKHQEMVQKLYEEADAAKDSSDNMLALYADFNSAAEGSDALTESAKKLAEALGTDIPEGAESAGKALTELTRQNLQDAINKLNTANVLAQEEFVRISGENDWNKVVNRLGHTSSFAENFDDLLPEAMKNQIEAITSSLETRKPATRQEIFDVTTLENALKFRDAMQQISDAFDEYVRNGGEASVFNTTYYSELQDYLHETEEAYKKVGSAESDLASEETKLRFLDLSSTIRVDSVEAYERLIKTINLNNRGSSEQREALIALAEQYYPQYTKALDEGTDALNSNTKAEQENATAADREAEAKTRAEAAVRAHLNALFDENGQLTEYAKSAMTANSYLADLVETELQAQLAAAQADYANLQMQLAGVSAQALAATKALLAVRGAAHFANSARAAFVNGENEEYFTQNDWLLFSGASEAAALEAEIQRLQGTISNVHTYTTGYTPSTGGSSGKGSGGSSGGRSSSSASTEDKKLTSLKERVTLLKSELSLMQERGDSEEDQIAKMREIMAALYDEQAYLKSIKGDQTTINGLLQEWYSYHNKIEDIMEKEAESAEKQAQAIQDALEAQTALNNVLNNRSVRYYNASTGQWEWTANQSDVQSAQSKLREAIQNLPEDQRGPFLYSLYHSPGGGPLGMTIRDFLPGEIASLFTGNFTAQRGGVNNYGNTYNFGGMNFNWQQAQSLTLAQFAQLAGGLGIYNNSP